MNEICEELVEAGKGYNKKQATERVTKGRQETARLSKLHNLCVARARSQRLFTWFLSNAVSHCSKSSLSLNLFSTYVELVTKVEAGKGEVQNHATERVTKDRREASSVSKVPNLCVQSARSQRVFTDC